MKSFLQDYYDFWFGVNNLYDLWAKKRGLTINEVFTLYIMDKNPGTSTQKSICDQLYLPKQTVNSLLKGFEKKGYIQKEITPEDQRIKMIAFTKKGQECADNILKDLYKMEESTFLAMSQEDRTSMQKGNLAFYQCLQKIMKEN